MKLDNDGYPHLVYVGGDPNYLIYAYQNVSGWHTEIVATLSAGYYYASLVFDQDGYPHVICSSTNGSDELFYAYKNGGGWHGEAVTGVTSVFDPTAIHI
jgi:hypothetical protein